MRPSTTGKRSYDHRIRRAICATGNPNLFPDLDIPRSTALSWIRRGCPHVVELNADDDLLADLQARIVKLQRRVAVLHAVVRLLLLIIRVSGFRFDWTRVPDGAKKDAALAGVAKSKKALGLRAALRILKMSPSRYHAWKRRQLICELDDATSCPRSMPAKLTAAETMVIKDMALDEAYRHLPITRLALLAQRLEKVFVSPGTWARLIRQRGWRRPRARVYPAKAKVGVQANAPNEYWHLDVTVVKLLDGTRVFVHAVIDNFSRRILAWRVASRLEPGTTRAVLVEATDGLDSVNQGPKVVTDSGVENVNGTVDELMATSALTRVLALVEVTWSNSKIEAFWRSLRHGWLYLNHLDSMSTLDRLVRFYVEAHNATPHSSFGGPTPDELYHGKGDQVLVDLAAARTRAREERLAANRGSSCGACSRDAPAAGVGTSVGPEEVRAA